MEEGDHGGAVARRGRCLARLRHIERHKEGLLLSDQHPPPVDRLLRHRQEGGVRVQGAQVSGEEQDNVESRRYTDHARALGRAVGLPQRLAAPPIFRDHGVEQDGGPLGPEARLRDKRAVGSKQLQGVQRDAQHVREGNNRRLYVIVATRLRSIVFLSTTRPSRAGTGAVASTRSSWASAGATGSSWTC